MAEGSAAQDRTASERDRVYRALTVVKVVLALALLRAFAAPASEDFFGEEKVGPPTWEWSLCALTPLVVLLLHRSPARWKRLSFHSVYLTTAAALYLFYAAIFAVLEGVWILWIAVFASLATFAGVWWLNRRERTRAR
ncbi:hypothetical protein ACIQPQ_06040 [Streptomyces sp. NPDC091281]|uniref:hypothetical protein n=1 Tax=Streptomyces sp. NPDC091281 TaxID=3365985 RepID=UPI0037F4764B